MSHYQKKPKHTGTCVCGREFETSIPHKKYCKPTHSVNHQIRKKLAKRKAVRWPKWQSKKEIAEFYKSCPEGFVVDHIIPLNHPEICGLNVINNLQYLTKVENQAKSNLWDGSDTNENWRKLLSQK